MLRQTVIYEYLPEEPLSKKEEEAKAMIEEVILTDSRPMIESFSGGKDSSATVILLFEVLLYLKKAGKLPVDKEITVISSDTLAELPPMLEYLNSAMDRIDAFAKENDLPVKTVRVSPKLKDTLNVKLIGVGMPPPNSSSRWCTDRLKTNPIESFLNNYEKEGFVTIVGTRRAEGKDRASKMQAATRPGTNLKINQRYVKSSNLTPIEHWTVKDVWSFLLSRDDKIIDSQRLWDLYADASEKNASECSFVGAGGRHIDEGKLGCGVSRFGCWQCYVTRDKDKALDGLFESGYEHIEAYKEYEIGIGLYQSARGNLSEMFILTITSNINTGQKVAQNIQNTALRNQEVCACQYESLSLKSS